MWKDALGKLVDVLTLRRITARVALSASLLGLATQPGSGAGAQPRVPVTPALTPEVTVRKFKGKYVLKRTATTFFMHLAGHRSHSSHSSHSSHVSHSSHSSSSHYSGSHFSSSVPAPRAPEPAPEPAPPPPPPKPKPLLRESSVVDRWSAGVLATPPETFDPAIAVEQKGGVLTIAPLPHQPGFSGYVSRETFDLTTSIVTVEVRRPAAGANTIVAAAIDAANWVGFRIENGRLSIESHTAGKTASHKTGAAARFLRLRTSDVAPVVVWETSANGVNWHPEYVETASINTTALRIALSAGTSTRVDHPGTAVFGSVRVERKP